MNALPGARKETAAGLTAMSTPRSFALWGRGSDLAYALAVACVISIAVFLRTQQLSTQWLMDDEWHAINKLTQGAGYLDILSSFGQYDYSIPLTVFYKLLADTVGLSELRMRMPMLLAGLAFCAVAIVWAKRRFGNGTALAFGLLVAVSPMLVNYSRTARPYMLTLLLAALAVWALAAWVRTGQNRYLGTYLPCAWLAAYLHLIMLPFVMAPWVVVLVAAFKGSAPRSDPTITLRRVFLGAAVAMAGAAVLVLPPLMHDWSAMASKTGSHHLPDADTFLGVWHAWLGTSSAGLVLLALALALFGLARVKKDAGAEAAMAACGLAALLAVVLVMRPAWIHNPQTLARYMLPALPLWLLLIAAGLSTVLGPVRSARLRVGIGAALLTGFALATPHAPLLQRPNNFTLHSYYQFDYRPDHNPVRSLFAAAELQSPFWLRLAQEPPASLLIAYGGAVDFESFYLPGPVIQAVHLQRMTALQVGGACRPARGGEAFPGQGIVLRNAVSLAEPGGLRDKGVDWVVLQHFLPEFARDQRAAEYEAWFARCRDHLVRQFGPPDYADAHLTAFRLARAAR